MLSDSSRTFRFVRGASCFSPSKVVKAKSTSKLGSYGTSPVICYCHSTGFRVLKVASTDSRILKGAYSCYPRADCYKCTDYFSRSVGFRVLKEAKVR